MNIVAQLIQVAVQILLGLHYLIITLCSLAALFWFLRKEPSHFNRNWYFAWRFFFQACGIQLAYYLIFNKLCPLW